MRGPRDIFVVPVFALTVLLAGGVAQADEIHVSTDGAVYALDVIEGGAVLVNVDDPSDEITLSENCSANHPGLGRGTWDGDDGGFRVRFGGTVIAFDGPLPLDAPECGG